MPRQKARCGKCGNETSRPQSYKGRTLCPPCQGTEKRADDKRQKEQARKPKPQWEGGY